MEQAPEAILNVLIIGAGQIGAFYDTPQDVAILTHAHAFTADPRFRLVGFYDAQPSRSQQAQARWGGQAFSSVAAAFQNQAIDIACITAPDEVHAELLQKLATYPVQLVFAKTAGDRFKSGGSYSLALSTAIDCVGG